MNRRGLAGEGANAFAEVKKVVTLSLSKRDVTV